MAGAAEFEFEDKNWQRIIGQIESKWKDLDQRKVFGSIISVSVFTDIMQHFSDQKGPSGDWEKWSKVYMEHMQKIGKAGNRILQDTGRLRQSLMPGAGKFRSNTSGVLFFTTVPYARAHDKGNQRMPQRQFMWLSKEGMLALTARTEKWLAEDKPLGGS